MLHVVVQRAIDVVDLATRQRREPEPVVVKVPPRPFGERQSEVENLAAEEDRGARQRVRDEERGKVRAVHAPPGRQRLPDDRARRVDEPHVAVDELSVPKCGS